MLNEYSRQSCIDLANYDATVEPGRRDWGHLIARRLSPGSLQAAAGAYSLYS
jgi:hypothetical protein